MLLTYVPREQFRDGNSLLKLTTKRGVVKRVEIQVGDNCHPWDLKKSDYETLQYLIGETIEAVEEYLAEFFNEPIWENYPSLKFVEVES